MYVARFSARKTGVTKRERIPHHPRSILMAVHFQN